jgi:hypothetical protein
MRFFAAIAAASATLWFGAAQAQTTWTITPSAGYTISDGGTSNGTLTFTLNGAASADGSTLVVGSTGSLATSAGVWTFGSKTASGGNQILLNGNPAGTGYGIELEVKNGGVMYTKNASADWYQWNGKSWTKLLAAP